jgi:hypothetical protein
MNKNNKILDIQKENLWYKNVSWAWTLLLPLLFTPALTWSSSLLSVGVPTQNLLVCGKGILPQFMTSPLPFPQFDLHCQWFLLCMPAQFFIWNNIRPKDLIIFPKAPVCKCCRPFVIVYVTFHVSRPYRRMDLTLLIYASPCNIYWDQCGLPM